MRSLIHLRVLCLLMLMVPSLGAYEYEYFKLALQWPPTFCMARTCDHGKTIPSTFTIHGLWPTNKTMQEDKGLTCENNEFYLSQIKNLEKKLKSFWPSFIGKDKDFWQYEWDTHGSCYVDDQAAYFELALDRRSSLDVINALEKKRIKPSRTNKYHLSDIAIGITSVFNIKAKIDLELLCWNSYKGQTTTSYLQEIRMCLEAKKPHRFISCPNGDFTDCENEVVMIPE